MAYHCRHRGLRFLWGRQRQHVTTGGAFVVERWDDTTSTLQVDLEAESLQGWNAWTVVIPILFQSDGTHNLRLVNDAPNTIAEADDTKNPVSRSR